VLDGLLFIHAWVKSSHTTPINKWVYHWNYNPIFNGCYQFSYNVLQSQDGHNCYIGLIALVHPKMRILSVFTHPHVVPNLYVFICSVEHKGRYLEECFNHTDLIPHW